MGPEVKRVATRNITLKLPEETLKAVKILAAERDKSVSGMLTEALEQLIREDTGYEQARREFMQVVDSGADLGTRGRVDWTRDELQGVLRSEHRKVGNAEH